MPLNPNTPTWHAVLMKSNQLILKSENCLANHKLTKKTQVQNIANKSLQRKRTSSIAIFCSMGTSCLSKAKTIWATLSVFNTLSVKGDVGWECVECWGSRSLVKSCLRRGNSGYPGRAAQWFGWKGWDFLLLQICPLAHTTAFCTPTALQHSPISPGYSFIQRWHYSAQRRLATWVRARMISLCFLFWWFVGFCCCFLKQRNHSNIWLHFSDSKSMSVNGRGFWHQRC